MCLITRVLELDILFTSANVKIILAGVDSTSDVKTLRIDLYPTSQLSDSPDKQSSCSTCWSHPHLGNSLPHLGLRQLSFFSSAAIRHDVHHPASITMFFHHLPFNSSSPRVSSWFPYSLQLLQCRASLGTTAVDFTLFTRSFTCCVTRSFTCCVQTGGPGGSGSRASTPSARCV